MSSAQSNDDDDYVRDDDEYDISDPQECIDFCAKHKIIPITKIVKATDLGEVPHHLTEAPSSHYRAANSPAQTCLGGRFAENARLEEGFQGPRPERHQTALSSSNCPQTA